MASEVLTVRLTRNAQGSTHLRTVVLPGNVRQIRYSNTDLGEGCRESVGSSRHYLYNPHFFKLMSLC
jgi:hypothetical protein